MPNHWNIHSMKLCRQENELPGGILESEAWQLGLYGPGRQKLNGTKTWSELWVRIWGRGGLGLWLDNKIEIKYECSPY